MGKQGASEKKERNTGGKGKIKAVLGVFKLLWFLLRMREWPLEDDAQ